MAIHSFYRLLMLLKIRSNEFSQQKIHRLIDASDRLGIRRYLLRVLLGGRHRDGPEGGQEKVPCLHCNSWATCPSLPLALTEAEGGDRTRKGRRSHCTASNTWLVGDRERTHQRLAAWLSD